MTTAGAGDGDDAAVGGAVGARVGVGAAVGAGVGVGTGVGVTFGVGDGLGDGGAVPVFKVHDVVGGNGAPHVCPNGVQNPTW